MEGENQKKAKCKPGSKRDKGEIAEETHSDEGCHGDANEELASPVMQAIYKEIRALRSDLKNEMGEF